MADSLRNLKIRDQILLVTVPLLFVLLCTLGLFAYTYWTAVRSGRVALRAEQSVARGEELLRDLFEMYMSVRNSVLLRSSRPPLAYETTVSALSEDIGELFDLESADPSQVREVHDIESGISRMQTEWAAPLLSRCQRQVLRPFGHASGGPSPPRVNS